MDAACILACVVKKVCSQYDENLFADHVCSNPWSHLLWGHPGMRWSASISTIDFHHVCVLSPIVTVVSKARGSFVKGTPWSPVSSSAFLCVPSLTVCRTAGKYFRRASCHTLYLKSISTFRANTSTQSNAYLNNKKKTANRASLLILKLPNCILTSTYIF